LVAPSANDIRKYPPSPPKDSRKISFLVFMEELYAREGVHHRTDGTRSRFVIVQRTDKLAGK